MNTGLPMIWPAAAIMLRYALNAIGTLLVAKGLTSEAGAAELTALLEVALGACVAVAMPAYGIWKRWRMDRQLVVAAGSPQAAAAIKASV